MSDSVFAVLALTVSMIPVCIGIYFKYNLKLKELSQRIDDSEKIKLSDEIVSLKHRVMTLEKIVTDRGFQVDDEISRLKSIK